MIAQLEGQIPRCLTFKLHPYLNEGRVLLRCDGICRLLDTSQNREEPGTVDVLRVKLSPLGRNRSALMNRVPVAATTAAR
jgi:hypothetical protein